MDAENLGSRLYAVRQRKKLTQEELAVRLGVTAQAVSKWERGAGLPDVTLLACLAEILDISMDELMGVKAAGITEDGSSAEKRRILKEVLAEPLLIACGTRWVPLLMKEMQEGFPGLRRLRMRFAKERGYLVPVIRILDEDTLPPFGYRILVYGETAVEREQAEHDSMEAGSTEAGSMEPSSMEPVYRDLEDVIGTCYAKILNRQIVWNLVENVRARYPAIVDGLVPEQVSLGELERILKEKIRNGESIRNLIGILEEL